MLSKLTIYSNEIYFLRVVEISWLPYQRLSQIATYWFVIGWFDNQSAQKSKVRQAAKDVVKSKVYSQIYSP